jgi:hypothetical protein
MRVGERGGRRGAERLGFKAIGQISKRVLLLHPWKIPLSSSSVSGPRFEAGKFSRGVPCILCASGSAGPLSHEAVMPVCAFIAG